MHLNPEEFTNLDLQVNKIPTPVLFWDMIFSTKDEKDYDWNADDYTHYVKFRESSSDALSSLSWSSSLHIAQFGTPELECTYSVVVPSRNRCNDSSVNDVSRPFRLTSHCFKGSYYFVIMEDEYPQLKLHNNCNFALHYGQGVPVLPEGKYCIS